MRFYSGFCFKNEQELFADILKENDFSVAGFSKGAIEAFEYVKNSKSRVDTLILISPAFFQTKDEKFKKLQLISYRRDPKSYIKNFYKNVLYPLDFDIKKYEKVGTADELKRLLYYVWNENSLKEVKNRGINIEVYLGEKDKIVDSNEANDFFKRFGTVYFIKNVGHILKG
ncbi:pimelyl-ACP methyl ester esterase BioV [Nitrosophilus labii]|uniref:pimelyl-ACP methyl ester esterase BioV n=1 Tax=Nitrosophilus labii TaxID=2706014 RepID=UPI001656A5A5|nr:pimelyl-ACP methyl ester esterase BioV [Nitrosophilus labii]